MDTASQQCGGYDLEMCQNKHLTEHGTATEHRQKTNKKCPFLNFCGGFTYFILFLQNRTK